MLHFSCSEQLITICFTTLPFYIYDDFPSAVLLPRSYLYSKDVVENNDVLFHVKEALQKIFSKQLPLCALVRMLGV